MVSLNLARIGQATSHLTAVMLAASGIAVLAAGALAAWMVRAMLRRLTRLPPGAEHRGRAAARAGRARAGCVIRQEPGPPPARPPNGTGRPSRTPAGSCAPRSASWVGWPSTTGIVASSAPPTSAA